MQPGWQQETRGVCSCFPEVLVIKKNSVKSSQIIFFCFIQTFAVVVAIFNPKWMCIIILGGDADLKIFDPVFFLVKKRHSFQP